jgi:putative glycosyltransferase (TIGR04372 family)
VLDALQFVDRALSAFLRSMAIDDKDFDTRERVVPLSLQLGRTPQAIRMLRRDLARSPNNKRLLLLLASWGLPSDSPGESLVWLLRTMAVEPADAEMGRTLSNLCSSKLTFADPIRFDQCFVQYARALIVERVDPVSGGRIVHIGHDQHTVAPSMRCLRVGVALAPSSAPVLRAIGFAAQIDTAPHVWVSWLLRALIMNDNDLVAYSMILEHGRDLLTAGLEDRLFQRYCALDDALALASADPKPERTVVVRDFSPWIGEVAIQLGLYVKASILGWIPNRRLSVPVARNGGCNRYFLDLWRPFVDLVSSPEQARQLLSDRKTLRYDTLRLLLPFGRYLPKDAATAFVHREWSRQSRPPLLSLNADEMRRGDATLRRMGVPENRPIVVLHCRDSGHYLSRGHAAAEMLHDFRNVDIYNYAPMIKSMIARGEFVLRLGINPMIRLTKQDGYLEYGASPFRSDFMDIFLCAVAKLFVGTASGPGQLAHLFQTPAVYANWANVSIPPWDPKDVFIPKLIWSNRLRRPLTLFEMLSPPARYGTNSEIYRRNGLVHIENTSDEILECVAQRLDEIEGGVSEDEVDAELRKRVSATYESTGNLINSRIGKHFLRKFKFVLIP